jgi:BolA protein
MLNFVRTMASRVTGGPIELSIREKLLKELQPASLDVFNDSWKHASHHGMKDADNTTESHFR